MKRLVRGLLDFFKKKDSKLTITATENSQSETEDESSDSQTKMGLTLSEALSIASEFGYTNQTGNRKRAGLKQGEGSMMPSRIIFRPGSKAERDSATREQVLLEIMENRGISREEAEIIFADPF